MVVCISVMALGSLYLQYLLCGAMYPPRNHDSGRLGLGVETLVSVKLVVIMEGVAQVRFTGGAVGSIVLAKKVYMCGTFRLIGVAICFSDFGY